MSIKTSRLIPQLKMNNQQEEKKENKALSSCSLETRSGSDIATILRKKGSENADNHLLADTPHFLVENDIMAREREQSKKEKSYISWISFLIFLGFFIRSIIFKLNIIVSIVYGLLTLIVGIYILIKIYKEK